MLNIQQLDIALAELRGQCPHDWEARLNICSTLAGGISAYWFCPKCKKPDLNINRKPTVDDPIADNIQKLIDFAKSKRIKWSMFDTNDISKGLGVKAKIYNIVHFVLYEDSEFAECLALGNCLVESLS